MIAKLLTALLLAVTIATTAYAGPMSILTTSGPGSLSDTAARFIQPLLAKEFNGTVIVENISGALGSIGMRAYQERPADGNTLLVGGTQVPYVSKKGPSIGFDPMEEFEPLYGLSYAPQLILVAKDSPIHSYKDLGVLYKKKGHLNGGSSHPSTEMSLALLDKVTGATTTIVSYKMGVQLASELAGGFIDYTVSASGNTSTQGLLSTGILRSVGTLHELGVEEFSWTGLFIHKNTPPEVKARLRASVTKVMNSPEMQKFHQTPFLIDAAGITKLMLREYSLIPK